ncbi:helix-turn-helix domain-containing protein [Sorangium cellulosum]|uniref:helix-turn-helix domain-containing protein n=1 Tax=Sorangium cellulosum TaxID=56 RepID=UPI0012DB3035
MDLTSVNVEDARRFRTVASEYEFDDLAREVLSVRDARTAFVENRLRRRIAESFEEARCRKNLSVRELAKEMGTSLSQVQRLLHHEVGGSLTLRTVCRAAEALNLNLSIHVREKQPSGGCVIPFGRVTGWQSISEPVADVVEIHRAIPTPAVARGRWHTEPANNTERISGSK